METNEIITKARRKSTIELQKALEKELTYEQREAFEFVLKSRGVEITVPQTLPIENVKVETIEEVKETVKEVIEVKEETVKEVKLESKPVRKVSKKEKDILSDYDFKPGDEVIFTLFKTKEQVKGLVKKIYQCKFTGFVYMVISVNDKIVHKRANVVNHV